VEARVVSAEPSDAGPHHRTPTRIPKPTRRKVEKDRTWQLVGGAVGGVAVVAVAAMLLKHGGHLDETPPPTQAQVADTKPAVAAGYPHLPPAGQLFPPGTVAAAVAYPQPLWKKHPLPTDGATSKVLNEFVAKTRFDPRLSDRVTAAFTAKPGEYVVVAEGPFLTPEFAAGVDALPGVAPLPASERLPGGAKLYSFPGTGRKNPVSPRSESTKPNFAGVHGSHWYAISNERRLILDMAAAAEGRPKLPRMADLRSDLLAAFPLPSAQELPLVTFAATGLWVVPTDADGETLESNGVHLAVADVRFDPAENLIVTLTLTGADKSKLKDFVSRVLGFEFAKKYPAVKPMTDALARGLDQASTVRVAAGWQLTVKTTIPLAAATAAVEGVLP
jgi:hypothetical protein